MSQHIQFSARPKVWIVAPSSPPYGGMSVQAKKLGDRLTREGFDAQVLPTNPPLPSAFRILERIPLVRTILREAQYLVSLSRTLRKPSVIHHFSASYLYFFLHSAPLLLWGRRAQSKIVLNYRGGKAADFLHGWSWLVVPLLRRADEIVVPSQFLRRVFQQFGLSASVLANLADIEMFPFTERQQFAPRLLVTRSLEPIYDVECVLRAFQIVKQQAPQAVLGIAGAGSEENRLRALAEKWKLRNVTFYGAVRHENLPSLYAQHDILVNASRVDNFPGALVEAASSGLAIVTTNAGGIPEMIRHGENGLLCDCRDASALAESALLLVRDREFACELVRNARAWAEQFCWQNVFPQLLQSYGLENTNALAPLTSCEALVR